jgi:uncharacterized protein involved in exopolysaccharide biosynthesis
MFVEMLREMADPALGEKLQKHVADLTAATKAHADAKAALDDTHQLLANRRADVERREEAVLAKEAALRKRDGDLEVAERQVRATQAVLEKQRQEIAEKAAAVEDRVKQAGDSEARFARLKSEAQALAAHLGGLSK